MIQPHYAIEHRLYGKMTAIVGEFCFFEMGLTHPNFTVPYRFSDAKEAKEFLQETYPDDDSFSVVPVE